MKVLLTTSAGDIVIELDAERAPKSTENFLGYVREGFYDGTLFHRVIDGFMIQAGGFEPGMRHKPPGRDPIECEADNGLSNLAGTVAMARTSDPHSAGAQFFINSNDNTFLDHRDKSTEGWGYAVFGKVVAGMEVVTRIEESPTCSRAGHQDVPVEDIVIERAEVIE